MLNFFIVGEHFNTFLLSFLLIASMGGLVGCKSTTGIVADGDGEWDTLAMEEEDFWMEEEALPYQAAATRSMDLLHMDLELGFDWNSVNLYLNTTIDIPRKT